jgi:hypothetical protein
VCAANRFQQFDCRSNAHTRVNLALGKKVQMAESADNDELRFLALKSGGADAPQVYSQMREEGFDKVDGIRMIRRLYSVSFAEAQEIVRSSNVPADRNPYELPTVRSYEELEQVMREDLGFCGCADAADAIEVLRDVLRAARDWKAAIADDTNERRSLANQTMLHRLNYEQTPGLATWFLYLLDHRNLIGHAGRITTCWIEDKGQQLLDATEQWYPPSQIAEGEASA